MTKEIQLSQGKVTLVDDEDFEFLNQWKWYAHKMRNVFYATRNESIGFGRRKTISMHRIILNVKDEEFVDHIDGNTLDNRKENLRICTISENNWNSKIRKDNTSGYKGVTFFKNNNKWGAGIKENGNLIYLGLFDTPKEAALAYNEKAIELFGEFARLNVIE